MMMDECHQPQQNPTRQSLLDPAVGQSFSQLFDDVHLLNLSKSKPTVITDGIFGRLVSDGTVIHKLVRRPISPARWVV